jgi:hypothetical protein
MKDPRGLIVAILTSTICVAILAIVAAWVIFGPDRVSESTRKNFFELILLLVGIISGYLLGRNGNGPRPG